MKTLSQTGIVIVLSYFAVVPTKVNVQMEEVKYSEESIKLNEDIHLLMNNIDSDKQKIYDIQKELNNK